MTAEWVVAWALAAQDLNLDIEDLDLERASQDYQEPARAWLVARDAAQEWQDRQAVNTVTEGAMIDAMRTELTLCRENLHRVTNELRNEKQARAALIQAIDGLLTASVGKP